MYCDIVSFTETSVPDYLQEFLLGILITLLKHHLQLFHLVLRRMRRL